MCKVSLAPLGTQMPVQYFTSIHRTVIEIFWSGPEQRIVWQTDAAAPKTLQLAVKNPWHVNARTVFPTIVIQSDIQSIWLMAMTWKTHWRINSPSHVFALMHLKTWKEPHNSTDKMKLDRYLRCALLLQTLFNWWLWGTICQSYEWSFMLKY